MSRSRGLKTSILISLFTVILLTGALAATVLAQIPANVRVGIVTTNAGSTYRNASSISFSVKGNYQIINIGAVPGEETIAPAVEGEQWQVYYLPAGVQLYKNGQPLDKVYTGPVVVKETAHDAVNRVSLLSFTSGGSVQSINRSYRGNMEFRSSGNSIIAINELPLEEYLYGVVPKEMSNSWPMEALKAQATAARTYVVANYNKRVLEGYNMLDTSTDQVYGGAGCEGANATKAVQDTAGQLILYNGSPVSALYHSNSGGHTEDSENVWSNALPYLRGKPDPYSAGRGLANWSYTTTIDDVRIKLNQAQQNGSQIGPIKSFKLEKYPSGRVKTVIITDIYGNTISRSGNEFGQLFNPGFKTDSNGGDNTKRFMSRFFDVNTGEVITPSYSVLDVSGQSVAVEATALYGVSDYGNVAILNSNNAEFYVIDASGSLSFSKAPSGKVVFEGHGWGHGVGLSQWGAYEMAVQGKTYTEILKFYYTGVEIKSNY